MKTMVFSILYICDTVLTVNCIMKNHIICFNFMCKKRFYVLYHPIVIAAYADYWKLNEFILEEGEKTN